MNKVYLDCLPKKKCNRHALCIDWEKSIGIPIKFIYDDVSDYLYIKSTFKKNSQIYLNVKYKNNIKPIYSGNFQKAAIGRIIGIKDNSFLYKINEEIVDDKRKIIIIDRYYKDWTSHSNTKIYKCKCNVCNYIWENDEYHLLDGNGCPVCANKVIIPGINDLGTLYPFTKKYFKNKEYENYSPHSGKKVIVCCPYCNQEKKIMISNLVKRKSIGCVCGDNISFPNKFIFDFFLQLSDELNILKREYRPKWSNGRIYDIYFEKDNKNFIVEMDGGFHNKIHTKSNLSLQDIKNIDIEKDNLARLHNIKMIRIDANQSNVDYIKRNIINSELSDIFDISKIDWVRCETYALNNIVKDISDYSKRNPNMCVTDICEIFHLSDTTTRRYLHAGNKLGWCNYDFNRFQKERARGGGNKREIIQFDLSMKFINKYESIKEASVVTGIPYSTITGCLSNRTKTTHGYIWKYSD